MPRSFNEDTSNQQTCSCQDSKKRPEPEPERSFDPMLFSMLFLTAIVMGNFILSQQPQLTRPASTITNTNNR